LKTSYSTKETPEKNNPTWLRKSTSHSHPQPHKSNSGICSFEILNAYYVLLALELNNKSPESGEETIEVKKGRREGNFGIFGGRRRKELNISEGVEYYNVIL
jgi:hypothetical protein